MYFLEIFTSLIIFCNLPYSLGAISDLSIKVLDKNHEKEIREFLMMTRNIFEPVTYEGNTRWQVDEIDLTPLESDAQAIEYLAHHNYNVEMAKFHFVSEMGCGKEVVGIKKTQELFNKQAFAGAFNEMKDRILKPSITKRMEGAYENPFSLEAQDDPAKGVMASKHTPHTQGVLNYFNFPFPRSYANDASNEENLQPSKKGETTKKGSKKGEAGKERSSSNNKLENKRRWLSVLKRGQDMLPPPMKTPKLVAAVEGESAEGSGNGKVTARKEKDLRASTVDTQALIDEATQLGPLQDTPGDTTAEEARQFMGDLLRAQLVAREWVSAMRDALKSVRFKHGPRVQHGVELAGLRELLVKSDSLRIRPPEVQILKTVITQVEKINKTMNSYNLIEATAALSAEGGENGMSLNGQHEALAEQPEDGKKTKKKKSSAKVSNKARANIDVLNDVIMKCKSIPFHMPIMDDIALLNKKTEELILEVESFLMNAKTYAMRPKSRVQDGTNGIPLSELEALRVKVLEFPVDTELVPSIDQVLSSIKKFKKEVKEIGASKGGSSRSSAGSVSIKRVEALLVQAETFIFDVSAELDILKNRKLQAREWLDRLKNTFRSKSKASLRKAGPDGVQIQAPVKMALGDMKMMVTEGESLIEQNESHSQTSRELTKAQKAVDIAEEWLARVRESFKEGLTEDSLRDMKDLIADSEDMPVYMEEAVVLKAHLKAIDWCRKACKVLYVNRPPSLPKPNPIEDEDEEGAIKSEGDAATTNGLPEKVYARPKLTEVQKLAKEVIKIREQVPDDVTTELDLEPLEEEQDCLGVVQAAEEWNVTAKRITQNGAIRKGTSLRKVMELYLTASQFQLNFDSELKPYRIAIKNAEGWLVDNMDILQALQIEVVNNKNTIKAEDDDNDDDGEEEGGMDVAGEGEEGASTTLAASAVPPSVKEEANNRLKPGEEVSYAMLQRVVVSGDNLVVTFEEINNVRNRLHAVEDWIIRTNKACTKNRRDNILTGRRDATGSSKDNDRPLYREDLVALLEEGNSFHVNLTKEKQQIKDTIQLSDDWTIKTTPILESLLSKDLNKLTFLNHKVLSELSHAYSGFDTAIEVPQDPISRMEEYVAGIDQTIHNTAAARMSVQREEEGRWLEELYKICDAAKSSRIEGNMAFLGAASKYQAIWQEREGNLNTLLSSLETLAEESTQIGVSNELTTKVELCIASLQWVQLAHELLIHSCRCGNTSPEDTKGPQSMKTKVWGDTELDFIVSFMQDAYDVISEESHARVDAKFESDQNPLQSVTIAPRWIIDNYDTIVEGMNLEAPLERLVSILNPQRRIHRKKEEEEEKKGEEEEGTEAGDADGEGEHGDSNKRASRKRQKSYRFSSGLAVDEPTTRGKRSRGKGKRSRDQENSKTEGDDQKKEGDEGEGGEGGEGGEEKVDEAVESEDKTESRSARKDISYQSKFKAFRKFLKEGTHVVPDTVQDMLDFWMRLIAIYLIRVYEAQQWGKVAQALVDKSIAASSTSGAQNWGKKNFKEFSYLLIYADKRDIHISVRFKVEEEIRKFRTWVFNAQAMMRREQSAMLDFDAFKSFQQQSSKLVLDEPVIQQLREEVKKAKNWVSRLQATGIERGLASTEALQKLLPEVNEICCDLSSFTDAIDSTTKTYCLCRQAYFGLMVGCDHCDDWFHASCVGLTKTQAEKTDRYICIRCSVERSFKSSCSIAAQISNTWCDTSRFNMMREMEKQRLAKKKEKEQRRYDEKMVESTRHEKHLKEKKYIVEDLEKAAKKVQSSRPPPIVPTMPPVYTGPAVAISPGGTVTYNANAGIGFPAATTQGNVPPPAVAANQGTTPNATMSVDRPAVGTDGTVTMTEPKPAVSTGLASITGSEVTDKDREQAILYERGRKIEMALREATTLFDLAKTEEDDFTRKIQREDQNKDKIVAWMSQIQGLIWPLCEADRMAGRPVGSNIQYKKGNELDIYTLTNNIFKQLGHPLLPAAICNMANYAITQGFDYVDDVLNIVESFRWMSWCSLMLLCLRAPPTTVLLRKMLTTAKGMKYADEKITKYMSTIMQRGQVWKIKARKYIRAHSRKVDLHKANALLIEGNQVPFSTRVKQVLQKAVKKGGGSAEEPSPEADDATGDKAKAGRKRIKVDIQDNAEPTYVDISAYPVYDSSDEERDNQRDTTSGHYATVSINTISPETTLWPLVIQEQPLSTAPRRSYSDLLPAMLSGMKKPQTGNSSETILTGVEETGKRGSDDKSGGNSKKMKHEE